jgi:hypothetical protein
MYPTLDVQTTLTFTRLHQDDIRASYPRRRRARTWLLRRTDEPTVEPRTLAPPAQHHPAAA